MSKKKILIVEDEPAIVDTLVFPLEREGFTVKSENTLESARISLDSEDFHLIVLVRQKEI